MEGNYTPPDLSRTLVQRHYLLTAVKRTKPPSPFLFFTVAVQAVDARSSPKDDWLEPFDSEAKTLHAHRSILPPSTGPLPRNAFNSYHHILDRSRSSYPGWQINIVTHLPATAWKIHKTVSLVCLQPHSPHLPACSFPCHMLCLSRDYKKYFCHYNAFKASSHISPHLLFVHYIATELELDTRAARVFS